MGHSRRIIGCHGKCCSVEPVGPSRIRTDHHTEAAAKVAQVGIPEVMTLGYIDLKTPVASHFNLFPHCDGSTRTLFSADPTGFTEVPYTELDRLVNFHGKIRGDDSRAKVLT